VQQELIASLQQRDHEHAQMSHELVKELVEVRRSHSPSPLQHTATRCNMLQRTVAIGGGSVSCSSSPATLKRTATHSNTLQHTAANGGRSMSRSPSPVILDLTLQHTATYYNTLQHTAANGGRSISRSPSPVIFDQTVLLHSHALGTKSTGRFFPS